MALWLCGAQHSAFSVPLRLNVGVNRSTVNAAPLSIANHRDAAVCVTPSMQLGRRLRSGAVALYAAIALSLTPNRPAGDTTSFHYPQHAPLAIADAARTSVVSHEAPAVALTLAKVSIHDLDVVPIAEPDDLVDAPRASVIDEGEFALSIRLVTAVALGALMGGEPGAAALSLGVRALTVVSVISALGTVYALLPLGVETTALVHVIPPAAAPLLAAGASLVALGAFVILMPRTSTPPRRRWRAQMRARDLPRRSAMTASLVALAAAAGAASAAGQALSAAAIYLAALAICRSAPLASRRSRRPLVSLRVDVPGGTRVLEGDSVDEVMRDLAQMSGSGNRAKV